MLSTRAISGHQLQSIFAFLQETFFFFCLFGVSVCFPSLSASDKPQLFTRMAEAEEQPWFDTNTASALQLEHTESNICTSTKLI